MMKAVVKTNNRDVKYIIRKIADESPELKDLNREQLEQIAKIVITQRLTNEMDMKAKIEKINYMIEKDIFIMQAGLSGSHYTKSAYKDAISELEKYCKKNDIDILLLSYSQADDFIYSMTGSPNSKRLKIAAISSFYSYLERRYSAIKNPIRGTKARPQSKPVNELEIPDDDEMTMILSNVPELEKIAIYIMAYRGLRVGALNNLKIWAGGYQTKSKGKMIHGKFNDEIVMNLRMSTLDNQTPFNGMTTNAIKLRVYRATKKLKDKGFINSAYSAHDFRHYFAISEYRKDNDIFKLSKLLDHSNIATTQTYLRSMNFDI